MPSNKPQHTVYSPIRQLTLAIAFAAFLFLVTRQLPILRSISSSLHLSAKYPQENNTVELDQPTREIKLHIPFVSQPNTNHTTNKCLRYIFYDKPVKTGSTAITQALTKYLVKISDPATPCIDMEDCTRVSEEVCFGQRPRAHLIQHLFFNASMTACLRDKGFYHVTSIREPKERIISAWRFSLTKQTSHYGIPYNASFSQFLERFPRCSLYSYYDLLPAKCTLEQAVNRVDEIVSRFDEIIDLSEHAVTDVHRRIQPFLVDVNVAPTGRAQTDELEVPDDVVELEYLLYNKMKEKRLSLLKTPRRALCEI